MPTTLVERSSAKVDFEHDNEGLSVRFQLGWYWVFSLFAVSLALTLFIKTAM